MVQILAPVGWLTQGESTLEAPPELSEVAPASTSSAGTSAIAWFRDHAIGSAAGATGLLAACGLAAVLALRGDEHVASLPSPLPAVAAARDEAVEPVEQPKEQVDAPADSAEMTAADEAENEVAQEQPVAAAEKPPTLPQEIEPPETAATSSSASFLPLITPPVAEASAPQPDEQRKLTLEPVKTDTKPAPTTTSPLAVAVYPPEIEAEAADVEAGNTVDAKPPADESGLPSLVPPARRTNVMDQLSVPIESITLPDVPIGEFVGFVSTMTAVPIELDPKVLGEVGLSSRSTVTVHGETTTAGKLLARVLKEHQLTCVERDGTLVVVRAKR